jgi:hypothetical protein
MANDLLDRFNETINDMLDECSKIDTPTVCNFISTLEGRKKIVELIQKKVIREDITIGQAINFIELEYNINLID